MINYSETATDPKATLRRGASNVRIDGQYQLNATAIGADHAPATKINKASPRIASAFVHPDYRPLLGIFPTKPCHRRKVKFHGKLVRQSRHERMTVA